MGGVSVGVAPRRLVLIDLRSDRVGHLYAGQHDAEQRFEVVENERGDRYELELDTRDGARRHERGVAGPLARAWRAVNDHENRMSKGPHLATLSALLREDDSDPVFQAEVHGSWNAPAIERIFDHLEAAVETTHCDVAVPRYLAIVLYSYLGLLGAIAGNEALYSRLVHVDGSPVSSADADAVRRRVLALILRFESGSVVE